MKDIIEKVSSLQLQKLSEEEKQRRGILGVLAGPCASVINATRNGRKYTNELWEKVFDNPLVKEQFKSGGIPGELGHPSDRTETDMSKIAIMMPYAPKKDKDGNLLAEFHILDTPNGRIAQTLAKYGYKLGISSRGSGELYTNAKGEECVDEDTFTFEAFDLVLLPACESARLNLVTESLNTNKDVERIINKGFSKAINEQIDKANADDKKIMQETLDRLNLVYTTKNGANINVKNESINSADDNGEDMISNLQKTLKQNRELTNQVRALQEKLSVCYTKETQSDAITNDLNQQILNLSESLSTKTEQVKELQQQLSSKNSLIVKFKKAHESDKENYSKLSEQLNKTQEELNKEKVLNKNLSEQIEVVNSKNLSEQNKLQENLQELTKDFAIKKSEFSSKIERQQQLVEKYKKIATIAVDRYIKSQAVMLGVQSSDIKNKLPKNYSFGDIDSVCESLKSYKLNINSLPFDGRNQNIKMQITESKKEPIFDSTGLNKFDDETDAQLLGLANFMGLNRNSSN